MPALPPACPGSSHGVTPELKASHSDRDMAVDILRVAAGDGRLTAAELDERLEAALTARTISELAALTADLPDGIMLTAAPRRIAIYLIAGNVADFAKKPVLEHAVHIEVRLQLGRNPAHVTSQHSAATTDDPTVSRWAFLQSLLSRPPTYRLLPD